MKNDFELIKKQFNDDITIYPISDVHLGSLEHNEKEWADFVSLRGEFRLYPLHP